MKLWHLLVLAALTLAALESDFLTNEYTGKRNIRYEVYSSTDVAAAIGSIDKHAESYRNVPH